MASNGNCIKENNEEYFEYLVESIKRFQDATNFNRVAKGVSFVFSHHFSRLFTLFIKLIPIAATADSVTCELTIDEEHVNGKGTLHGGQTVSLVDIITARAVGVTDRDMPMVSVDLSTR